MRKPGGWSWAAVLIAGSVLAATPLHGQDAAGALAVVEQIFEGMRTASPALVREVFAPDARFAVVDDADGSVRVAVQSVDR